MVKGKRFLKVGAGQRLSRCMSCDIKAQPKHITMLLSLNLLLQSFISKHPQRVWCPQPSPWHEVPPGKWGWCRAPNPDWDIKPKVHCSRLKANPKLHVLQGEMTALLWRSRVYGDGEARSLAGILLDYVTHQVSGYLLFLRGAHLQGWHVGPGKEQIIKLHPSTRQAEAAHWGLHSLRWTVRQENIHLMWG